MFKDNFGRNLLKQPKIPLRIYTTSRTFENCTKITRCVKRTAIWHNFQCKSLIKRAKSQDFTHVFKRLDSLLENKHFYSGCSLYSCLQNQQYLLIVFPLVQPVAQLKCSKKHSVFFCECKSDIGNPPPLAYWTENGKNIGDFGYRAKVLTTDDITKGEPAMYSCNVKSHNLTDEKNIILGKRLCFTYVLLQFHLEKCFGIRNPTFASSVHIPSDFYSADFSSQKTRIRFLRHRKKIPCFHTVIETLVEIWKNEKLRWEHEPLD